MPLSWVSIQRETSPFGWLRTAGVTGWLWEAWTTAVRHSYASLLLRQGGERYALVATGFPITSLACAKAEQRLWSFSFHITMYHWIWGSSEWVEKTQLWCAELT